MTSVDFHEGRCRQALSELGRESGQSFGSADKLFLAVRRIDDGEVHRQPAQDHKGDLGEAVGQGVDVMGQCLLDGQGSGTSIWSLLRGSLGQSAPNHAITR